jgi:hypothetical protein
MFIGLDDERNRLIKNAKREMEERQNSIGKSTDERLRLIKYREHDLEFVGLRETSRRIAPKSPSSLVGSAEANWTNSLQRVDETSKKLAAAIFNLQSVRERDKRARDLRNIVLVLLIVGGAVVAWLVSTGAFSH